MKLSGQVVQQASGTLALADERLAVDVQIMQKEGRAGRLNGAVLIHTDGREVDVAELTVTLGRAPWRLVPSDRPPTVGWSDEGLVVSPLLFVGGAAGDERIAVSGSWRSDGQGALRVTATHMFLDTLEGAFERPASYGGVVDLDATIRGTPQEPIVKARVAISEGRVQRFSYQSLVGRVDHAGEMFDVDLRLDQSPGVWMNAAGTVPLAMFNPGLAERPIHLVVTSSSIGLGLIEGLTDVVRNVTGELRVNATVVGTSRDPHFQGDVGLTNAAFLVTLTGVRYQNGRAALTLASDRIGVDTLHIEDGNRRPLDAHGSLGTHEMTVGDLEIDAQAQGFEIVRNEFGRLAVDLTLRLRGRLETPRLGGVITIASGDLKVDEILARTLFQPYATEAMSTTVVDAVAALNPWDRLGLDISLHVPTQMRLTGENVQVSPDTPVGLGNINLRVGGDLYLYKDPGQPPSVTGSLDRIAGTYTFQGRRFDIDEAGSSINFHGDLNPEAYVSVTRLISGVLTRVTITGELRSPAIQLTSTPPLDQSDILSLIVFNTSTNQLSSAQQQELALRGATLAAGFFAAPLLSALESELGLDTLDIEPAGELGTGPKVTVGEEIAPGLIARFSRQFGSEPYDEATVEYYLARILRLRATFSDAASVSTRASFRRVERAGVDLLIFFSF
ncbi:MAG: hypothetical protein DMF92_13785 [Acidobacteria bacterium]|nr:MAG: hypothetical protein DMF92_13785 [Acidobacteriota bacterium]